MWIVRRSESAEDRPGWSGVEWGGVVTLLQMFRARDQRGRVSGAFIACLGLAKHALHFNIQEWFRRLSTRAEAGP